jgi:hypothetical protein
MFEMTKVHPLEPSLIQDYKADEIAPMYGRNVDGYGSKIPTRHWLKVKNRWRRIYTTIYSNIGTSWIVVDKKTLVVRDALDLNSYRKSRCGSPPKLSE